jgi:predicted MFS family arabinose efflux permease
MRLFIFILFLVLSVVVDLDNGIFNASVNYIMKDLNMNTTEYGVFASISFSGRIIGLIIFMIIINFRHRKATLIITIILHGSSYIIYYLTNNNFILTSAKMFAAANKVCGSIYRPVWIEQFGISNYKTILFSIVQIMSSYGQVIGFNLGSFYFHEKWKLSLFYILIVMYIIAICFVFVPIAYFKRNYMSYENNEDDSESNDDSSRASLRKQTVFVKSIRIKKKSNIKRLFKDLCHIIKNIVFFLCIIKRSNATFIFQIIHSFLKVYQENVLKDSNDNLIALFYNIASLVSTTIGGLLGGLIANKLGGYEKKRSIFVVIIPEIITVINIIFLANTSKFYIFNINLISFFCFVSASTPVIQGYLIKTIPKSIKGIGIGLDMIVSTFLGKIPGPIIYGLLEDKYSEENPSLAWKISISYYYVGSIIVILICFFKCFEKVKKNASEVKLQDHIVDIAGIGSGSDGNDIFKFGIITRKRSHTDYKPRKSKTDLSISDDLDDITDMEIENNLNLLHSTFILLLLLEN